jgi:RecB family exonuclease
MSKQEFEDICEKYTDKFLSMNIPAAGTNVKQAKEEILQIALNAYENDVKDKDEKEIEIAETKHKTVHEASGVRLAGFPDRVEHYKDGKFCIGDFKTGRTVHQDEKEPKTWLQTMCYAYIVEQIPDFKGKISYVEYRYPQLKEQNYSREYKQSEIDEILKEFKNCLEHQTFPPVTEADDTNPAIKGGDCSFCDFINICGKGKRK